MKSILIAVLKVLAKSFSIRIANKAVDQIKKLKTKDHKAHKAVSKALKLMASNIRHQGLSTHKWISSTDKGPNGEQLFESYASQGGTAFRVFWYYDTKEKDTINITTISKHP